MLLRRTNTAATNIVQRTTTKISLLCFSTTTTPNPSKPFAKIPWKYRLKAIQESQKALLDYFHTTRSLPFIYADQISRYSPQCLEEIVSKVPFSPSNFLYSCQRFLLYHQINELDFFLESIGLNRDGNETARDVLPKNTFFISDWERFDVVCALAEEGFPWGKLGLLFRENSSTFDDVDASELKRRIREIKDSYGFNSISIIGICLAFPQILYSNADGFRLLGDLKILFLDYDLLSCVEYNVDAVFEICEKVKVFYYLGCKMELMGRSKSVFIEYSKEHLIGKIEYFCRLGVRRDQVGVFLLSKPEIFGIDLESKVISVSGFLSHFGMGEEEVKSLKQKYPLAFGRNRLANVHRIMRVMNLGEWFSDRMQSNASSLFTASTMLCTEDVNEQYEVSSRRILRAKKRQLCYKEKLDFLHSIGFGENEFAIRAMQRLHGRSSELQQRFDFLLGYGIEYSEVCAMLMYGPCILNLNSSKLEEKIEYFRSEMGLSLQDLHVIPGILFHDLEKRIKPRCRFHKWLKEQGYCDINFSLSTIVASGDKPFKARISRMDPAAARVWQEKFLKLK